MNKYRSAALALAACAASLALAACSAGTPTASSASASTGTPGQSGSAAASSPIPGRALAVTGKLGTFPVPAAARIVENMPGHQSFLLVFGLVTPAEVSRFYATALPQAGFTVTTNAMLHQGGDTGAYIVFTGHGFKGNINSLVQFPGYNVAGLGDKNVTTIVVTPAK